MVNVVAGERTAKLQYLINQLQHPLPTLRYDAARALGELNNELAVNFLLTALKNDKNGRVREAAALALNDLGINLENYDFAGKI